MLKTYQSVLPRSSRDLVLKTLLYELTFLLSSLVGCHFIAMTDKIDLSTGTITNELYLSSDCPTFVPPSPGPV